MIMGHIFKNTIPDESDEVRRELERCVRLLSRSAVTDAHVNFLFYILEWSQKQQRANQSINTYVEKPEEKAT
jgi:hypothetical protein